MKLKKKIEQWLSDFLNNTFIINKWEKFIIQTLWEESEKREFVAEKELLIDCRKLDDFIKKEFIL
jgi:hypothetical protein